MATAAQITANRANTQKSTGPRTEKGKSAACMNALKHGLDAESILLPGENAADYEELVNAAYAQFDPRSPLEEQHVATLIHSDWMRRRLRRIQGKIYRALLAEGPDPIELDVAVLRDSPTAKLLRRVTSELSTLERSYYRALKDLRALDTARQDMQIALLTAPPRPSHPDEDLPANLASFPEPTRILGHSPKLELNPPQGAARSTLS
jgi:hypothetical protein